MIVYRDIKDENGVVVPTRVFDIMEATYTGKDMGERKIDATIKWPTPIDICPGDYMMVDMQTLRKEGDLNGFIEPERFAVYTMPTIKKTARPMSCGDAFENNVTFYPPQYELGTVLMRDFIQQRANDETLIYTGFDQVTFYGGAFELLSRVKAVLDNHFGEDVWNFEIADAVNEQVNTALERFAFSFSGNTVMDALLKLNDKEGVNTTFFITGRTIYVGFRRPYLCKVDEAFNISGSKPLNLKYGKTSQESVGIGYGGLYSITKSVGGESPITRLYAYGANRNLNRYYCSDRIKSGRYVNKLMLPSFDNDGRTDYIEAPQDIIDRFGIREASKDFEEIYPSLRNMTYGDLRQIKYCIKVRCNKLDEGRTLDHTNSNTSYPIVRVQCYKVVEGANGINHLEESLPEQNLAVFIHAAGKIVRTVLYANTAQQVAHDAIVPKDEKGNIVPGSCYAINDRGFDESGKEYKCSSRDDWFQRGIEQYTKEQQDEIVSNRIEYADTFWLTDLYVFQGYDQTFFNRDGYSAWCWPRTTKNHGEKFGDGVACNEIVEVEPIVTNDTIVELNDGTIQQTFDVYMHDVGFTFDEQNDFGEMVFVFDDIKMSFLDGLLTGREYSFIVPNQSNTNAICAYREDGTINEDFFKLEDYSTPVVKPGGENPLARQAFNKGAIWRVTCKREVTDDSLGLVMPMKGLNAKSGDHVVFLDLYMPDIYIHAAENRLLRDAWKYLNANDKGKVNYDVEFDKVRFAQIPQYALQMREGINVRMIDEDLDIRTEVNSTELLKSDNGVSAEYIGMERGKRYKVPVSVNFTADKYVEVTMYSNEPLLAKSPIVLQSNNGDYTISDAEIKEDKRGAYRPGLKRYVVSFELPSGFNEDSAYYIVFVYSAISLKTPSASLISVVEYNVKTDVNADKYVDFKVESVTIKMSDNTRSVGPVSSGRARAAANGGGQTKATSNSKSVQAKLAQSTTASAWATMMNEVQEQAIESEQNRKTWESLAKRAREHYRELLNLRDNIFDPDGTCDQTFLHVMMLQVGADSMNFQLDNTKTRLEANGSTTFVNFRVDKGVFYVDNSDTLRHYVYTQGAQGGNWTIPGNFSQVLNQVEEGGEYYWPVYYVCLKCRKDSDNLLTDVAWVCSTKQYAVNDTEDSSFWYFNWGILTPDANGEYSFMETRGNAYMYGDNLVCGRISSLAKNSWFDLNTGNFVLGSGEGNPSLSYINGVLTISGAIDDKTKLETILSDEEMYDQQNESVGEALGILEDGKWKINLDEFTHYTMRHNLADYIPKSISYNESELSLSISLYEERQSDLYAEFGVSIFFSDGTVEELIVEKLESSTSETNNYRKKLPAGKKVVSIAISDYNYDSHAQGVEDVFFSISCELRAKYSVYDYLTEALNDSTEIQGGLVLTNVLALKDPTTKKVNAGMSGVEKHNVLMWGGAEYDDANYAASHDYKKKNGELITTLIKRDGTGKVGVFRIGQDMVKIDNGNMNAIWTLQSINEYIAGHSDTFASVDEKYISKSQSDAIPMAEKTTEVALKPSSVITITNLLLTAVRNGTGGLDGASISIKIDLLNNSGTVVKNLVDADAIQTQNVQEDDVWIKGIVHKNEDTPTAVKMRIHISHGLIQVGAATCEIESIRVADESEYKMCIFASDGMVISNGIGKQFRLIPNADSMDMLCDLPSYNKAMPKNSLYIDGAGIVRVKLEDDADDGDVQSYKKFRVGAGSASMASIDLQSFVTTYVKNLICTNLPVSTDGKGLPSGSLYRNGNEVRIV